MNRCTALIVCLILQCHRSLQLGDDVVVLINDPAHVPHPSYTYLPSNERAKRDLSAGQCDPHAYTKLYSCSQLTDCAALSSCLQSIHCSVNNKSFGSVIVNLLHLLGINDCQRVDQHLPCPNAKRLIILHALLTHWTDTRVADQVNSHGRNVEQDGSYCQTISSFVTAAKNEVRDQCSMYTRPSEGLLESYLCSATGVPSSSEQAVPWSKLDETLRKLPKVASKVVYFDEEEYVNFAESNKNLQNTTEQTVYTNDHRYYNVSYVMPKPGVAPLYFVPDSDQFVHVHALFDRHRTALSIGLKFNFPFYGHGIQKVVIGTGGFIYTGDMMHSALIGSTQYVAPFMANFDVSIGGNHSEIKYFDNSTHFICTWNNLYLQDQPDLGPFTFQAILENTGHIYFNYIRIPSLQISESNHAHRIGLSDAYMSEHSAHEHVVRVITLYDKLNLDREKIRDGVSVVFQMDTTCNTFMDCGSCLANRGLRYNCSWCGSIQKCSDGNDRSHQEWTQAQCHYLASKETCTDIADDFPMQPPPLPSESFEPALASRQHSALSTFRAIVLTLLTTVLILSLIVFLGSYLYAYRHPTSPPGIWLLEHRPSNYIARFKRFAGSSSTATS